MHIPFDLSTVLKEPAKNEDHIIELALIESSFFSNFLSSLPELQQLFYCSRIHLVVLVICGFHNDAQPRLNIIYFLLLCTAKLLPMKVHLRNLMTCILKYL